MAKRARNPKDGSKRKRRSSPPPPPDFWAMNGRKVIGAIFVIAIVIAAAYVVVNYEPEGDNGPGTPGDREPAPTFSVTDIDGIRIDLEAYRGRVVVLDLFATWCGPCVTQMEELNQLQVHYPPSQLVIISIDVDTSETTQQIRTFRDDHNANWAFASDTDNVGTKYDAGSIPTLAIIDQDGDLVWRHAGVASFGQLQGLIDPLLMITE